MDIDINDIENVVKSLGSQVMKLMVKHRKSPEQCQDHMSDNTRAEELETPFKDEVLGENNDHGHNIGYTAPLILQRTGQNDELKQRQTFRQAIRSENDHLNHSVELCRQSKKSTRRSDSVNMSTSCSSFIPNQSLVNLLNVGLGLSEIHLNCSSNSQTTSMSHYPRQFTIESSCGEYSTKDINELSYFTSQKLHKESDADSTASMSPSDFGSYTTESDSNEELVNIRYDTSCSSYAGSLQNNSSIRKSQPDSSFRISSLVEEFVHDIDFLAKSSYRTSTPDPKTSMSKNTSVIDANRVESNNRSISCLNMSHTTGSSQGESDSSQYSAVSFKSTTDSRQPLSQNFVHGLSPLCRQSQIKHDDNSTSRAHVRRSLFATPSHNVNMLPRRNMNISQTRHTNVNKGNKNGRFCSSSNTSSGLSSRPQCIFVTYDILPKPLFRDETDEAVYYLITKYLNNKHCKW